MRNSGSGHYLPCATRGDENALQDNQLRTDEGSTTERALDCAESRQARAKASMGREISAAIARAAALRSSLPRSQTHRVTPRTPMEHRASLRSRRHAPDAATVPAAASAPNAASAPALTAAAMGSRDRVRSVVAVAVPVQCAAPSDGALEGEESVESLLAPMQQLSTRASSPPTQQPSHTHSGHDRADSRAQAHTARASASSSSSASPPIGSPVPAAVRTAGSKYKSACRSIGIGQFRPPGINLHLPAAVVPVAKNPLQDWLLRLVRQPAEEALSVLVQQTVSSLASEAVARIKGKMQHAAQKLQQRQHELRNERGSEERELSNSDACSAKLACSELDALQQAFCPEKVRASLGQLPAEVAEIIIKHMYTLEHVADPSFDVEAECRELITRALVAWMAKAWIDDVPQGMFRITLQSMQRMPEATSPQMNKLLTALHGLKRPSNGQSTDELLISRLVFWMETRRLYLPLVDGSIRDAAGLERGSLESSQLGSNGGQPAQLRPMLGVHSAILRVSDSSDPLLDLHRASVFASLAIEAQAKSGCSVDRPLSPSKPEVRVVPRHGRNYILKLQPVNFGQSRGKQPGGGQNKSNDGDNKLTCERSVSVLPSVAAASSSVARHTFYHDKFRATSVPHARTTAVATGSGRC